ncbi:MULTISPECIES: phosphotransferase [Pseudoalteromonas]|uniref:phosphotransferase n=1 Tax=Pseudoalteromonas TaxID=53246 RepID=UPI000E3592E6|nr:MULTISPECIES: phosphotransferase [Pseudoalteromonas]AXQ97361.1 hypothetical protein D0N37_06015 [Pseudoalteromonas piscicida]RXE86617.1 hypothetical protein DRB05_10285 [Pseudoalteromonas sp. A757]
MNTQPCSERLSGWKLDAKYWIENTLKQLNYKKVDEPIIVEDWFLGDVWRIPTEKGNVYFKATASLPLFSNEAGVCDFLAHIFKGKVPEVLAIDKGRRWQLTSDFGEPLDEDVDLTVWNDAYQVWGEIQSLSVEHVDKLRQSGCQSRSIENLSTQLIWHFNQPEIAAILTDRNIVFDNNFLSNLEIAIHKLKEYSLPDCLVHGDLHESNMARTAESYLFFDWSDACVTHPFMDGNFIYQFSETNLKQKLIKNYLSNWRHYLPELELQRAWQAAEPVCYAHHTLSYASIILNASGGNEDDVSDFTESFTRYLSCLTNATRRQK